MPLIPVLDLVDLVLECFIIKAFMNLNNDYESSRTNTSLENAEGLIEGHKLPLLTREYGLLIVACSLSIMVDFGEFIALFKTIILQKDLVLKEN
jgi:hypothetical protein